MTDGLHLYLSAELDEGYFSALYEDEDEARVRSETHAARAAFLRRAAHTQPDLNGQEYV